MIALDRLIRARYPYRTARLCTRKVAILSTIIVCLCSALFTSHVLQPEFAYASMFSSICGPSRSSQTTYSFFFYNIWSLLQLIVTYFIPSCLMLACILGLHKKMRGQRNLAVTSTRRERLHLQMLILMLASVVFFVICILPYSIHLAISLRLESTSTSVITNYVLQLFLKMNYSCNFYVHCLSSGLFRKTFLEQLKRMYFYWTGLRREANNSVYPLTAIPRARILPTVQ